MAALTLDYPKRWLPTPVLMRLMRHESIQTTMAYYVSLECDEIAEELYNAHGDASQRDGRPVA